MMLILLNKFFGEVFFNWVIASLEKMAISFWEIAGAAIIMILGIALCLSLVVNANFHVGGFFTFITSTVISAVIAIIAIKWLVLFVVFGIPALIIVFGIHRAMRNRNVNQTARALFLWATILLII